MQIRIVQPNPEYPLAYVHVNREMLHNPELGNILDRRRFTPLGPWENHATTGSPPDLRCPVLLEDEHVKPKPPRKAVSRPKVTMSDISARKTVSKRK